MKTPQNPAEAATFAEKMTDLLYRIRFAGFMLFLRVRSLFVDGVGRRPVILCYPELPRFFHVITTLAAYMGARIVNDPTLPHDTALYFEDTTVRAENDTIRALAEREFVINEHARDISKTHVEEVFSRVFGYTSHVDPRTYEGAVVSKSVANAIHDGHVVTCPLEPKAGRIYQRVLNNREGEYTIDFRVPFVYGTIPITWKKYKHLTDPFNHMLKAEMHRPDTIFSKDELARLTEVARQSGIDYGEFDVIRDNTDGRIYVVDINNTPGSIHPVEHLPWGEYYRMIRAIGDAFKQYFITEKAPPGSRI